MISQQATLALLGVVAAAPAPWPKNGGNFPLFATPKAPATADSNADAAGNVLLAYSKVGTVNYGPLRAYRNGLYTFPTQVITKADIATEASVAAVAAQATTTRAFWQTDLAQIGTYPTVLSSATDSTNYANGATWLVCSDSSTGLKCNGGTSTNGHANNNTDAKKYKVIPHRIVLKGDVADGTAIQVAATNTVNMTWNKDILMASFYHQVWTDSKLDDTGNKWCSPFMNVAKDDGTPQVLAASNGLNGKSKCSWYLKTETGKTGPSIMLRYADYVNFSFQWIEWIDDAALGSGAVIAKDDAANYHIGAYDPTKGVFLNPMKTIATADTNWKDSALAWGMEDRDPMFRPPNSIGDAIYYTHAEGPFMDKQTMVVDSTLLMKEIK